MLSHDVAKRVVNDDAVRLRGWDFPHYDPNSAFNTPAYVGLTVDWSQHVEMWRMYRSGQFAYLGATWDVALDFQDRLRNEFDRSVLAPHPSTKASVVGLLSFIGMIYTVTEFFVFASRLATTLGYASNVRLEIAMHNTEGWALVSGDQGVPWHGFYQSHVNDIRLTPPAPRDLGTDTADAAGAARTALAELFACFNWSNSAGAIQTWQTQFLSGRFL